MITQIDAKSYDALIARLAVMPGSYAIVYPGQIYPTAADTPFILVTDARFGNDRVYLSSTADDVYAGFLMLDVMVPLSWTHSQMLGIAGVIRDWFAKDLVLSGLVRIDRTATVTTSYRDGSFNRMPVAIRWRAMG